MNYPKGIKKNNTSKSINITSFSNRGMSLEAEINLSNEYYLNNNIANIHKKPTPVVIVKVDYKSRKEAVINEAYFKVPSTTDYNGIYKGKYVDFEAKETKNKNYFPLANIHKHQIDHLKNIEYHNGISFLIIRFTLLNRTYLLESSKLSYFINNNDRKSIPLSYFEDNAFLIKDGYQPRIDYLKILDEIYFGGNV